MKKGFTLIEVTLAMGIMAVGVLSVVGLYSFGYKESAQSREDVGATAVADAVLSQLTMAITSTNLRWQTFKTLRSYPSAEGWGEFIDRTTGRVTQDPTARAKSDFASFLGALGVQDCDTAFPQAALDATGLKCGLVILHDENENPAIVRIGFRAMKQHAQLLSAPLFYTEAKFMGVDE